MLSYLRRDFELCLCAAVFYLIHRPEQLPLSNSAIDGRNSAEYSRFKESEPDFTASERSRSAPPLAAGDWAADTEHKTYSSATDSTPEGQSKTAKNHRTLAPPFSESDRSQTVTAVCRAPATGRRPLKQKVKTTDEKSSRRPRRQGDEVSGCRLHKRGRLNFRKQLILRRDYSRRPWTTFR